MLVGAGRDRARPAMIVFQFTQSHPFTAKSAGSILWILLLSFVLVVFAQNMVSMPKNKTRRMLFLPPLQAGRGLVYRMFVMQTALIDVFMRFADD